MESMHELKEMLCEELENIARKGNVKMADLGTLHMLTDTIKNIMKIDALGGGYSQGWRAEGDYSRNYDRGNSYGRYSRDSAVEHLENMMREKNLSSSDRATLRKAMEMLR